MSRISVLLVDDNPVFLSIATQFLQAHDDLMVIGAVTGGEEALLQAQDLRPDVVLVDLVMPDLPGLEIIPRLRTVLPEAGVIALTTYVDDAYRRAALDAGANEFVSKTDMGSELLPAIRLAAGADRTGEKPASTHGRARASLRPYGDPITERGE
jgi:DNA-binding NarL/FixJ family response regulator